MTSMSSFCESRLPVFGSTGRSAGSFMVTKTKPLLTSPPPKPPTKPPYMSTSGRAWRKRLDLAEDAIAGVEARPHGGLEADPEPAHVLRGDELLPEELDDPQGEHEEDGGPGQHEPAVVERRHQQALVAGGEPGERGG